MVIMASPSRRQGVQAVSQLRRLARHRLGDYGVASRALVVALASDSSRRTLHGRKIGCARAEKRVAGSEHGGNRAHIPPAWARPIPAAHKIERLGGKESRERKRRGRRQQHLESGGAPPPSSHRCSFHAADSRLLLAARPLTSAPPIRPSDWTSDPPICPFDWTSARRSAPPIGPPPVDLHFRPLPPSIRGCFLCSASMLASFMLAHKYTLLSLLCSSFTFFLCSESFGLGHAVVMSACACACACALLASSLWCWLFVLAC